MHITVITLFPQLVSHFFNTSIPKRAQEEGKVTISTLDLRNFGVGKHKMVDDKPYGGGVGMVLKVDVLDSAITAAKKDLKKEKVILLDPKGAVYNQSTAENLLQLDHIILVCGHYEGFDERIRELVDMEISIGDFVLSGGEIAAVAIIDSLIRLVPGVLKKTDATHLESFSKIDDERILEYPQYTRPEIYKGMAVPKVLLSGDPKKILAFQKEQAQKETKRRRPDLLKK